MIRMSVNRILPFLLLLVLFTSCNRKYKIEGSSSVASLDGKMLFLKTLQDGQWVNVDSAEVIHGHFKMKGRADSVMMVTLYMDHEGIMPLVLEDGKIVISISNTQLIAKGTPLCTCQAWCILLPPRHGYVLPPPSLPFPGETQKSRPCLLAQPVATSNFISQ